MSDDAKTVVKKSMVNTGFHTRVWIELVRAEDRKNSEGEVIATAGSTLELDPGESALVEVAPDFEDPWLKEAKVASSKRESPRKETSTSE